MPIKRAAASLFTTGVLVAASTLALASPAVAAAQGCGWQGDGTQNYNHCGSSNVMLRVEHVFGADDHFCTRPGMVNINAGNSPYNTWRTTFAVYEGGPVNCAYGWYR
ncbi:hypothetical protein JOF53_006892 [Crossiella equi]|uniref:Uncharacterized protein n=1 Tax=Crossiella equi TaxID=130796 RepID=A0ABS5AN66_9PSEU|nr:DUF6355 family natural product biosynthesis protein [Crossiella equi]MBP2478020.1 hypothetical protein [Crossiella equi]